MALGKPTMCLMIQNRFRGQVTALISPIAKAMLNMGLTPNAITTIGALGGSISAIYFFSYGDFFIGTLVVSAFVLSDLFDGTMARLSNTGSTRWGALIDSTLDRVMDSAILIGVLLYAQQQELSLTGYLAVVALVIVGLIPYIRAKAESLGIECSVGIAERTERLIVVLVGTGLYGLGLNPALNVALGLVIAAGTVTVMQRMRVVARAE
jgi:CDP-diacylglycerol--glycerol-3-phosphate 3-phosphatidyltransferase